jgi:2,4-dienoyl-CoA reductase-like NADH-dependent reductase (Old Yellow Enzyme family)
MVSFSDTVTFAHGPAMKNRFMLAPLTNMQSHDDGTLSDDEHQFLVKRAEGGFGLVMTCASHVQKRGQGFKGQLGCFSDDHIPGLTRLARDIKAHGSVAIVQLHHAGNRSPQDLIGEQPVCPSDDAETGARALSTTEVEALTADFVAAALRCDAAGFDGVELHGAHSYMLCQFLSADLNARTDRYGGSLENRSRLIFDILDGIRKTCREDFNVSIRLSPERFGMRTSEIVEVYERLVDSGLVDFIDMSLWDVFKDAADEAFAGQRLLDIFATLPRKNVRLGVAGKLYSAKEAHDAIDGGADFAILGRGAILHHDFPRLATADPAFVVRDTPVSPAVLHEEGLSDAFVNYMRNWQGFVTTD